MLFMKFHFESALEFLEPRLEKQVMCCLFEDGPELPEDDKNFQQILQ